MKVINLIALLYLIMSLIITSFIHFPNITFIVWTILGFFIAILTVNIAIFGQKKIQKRKI